MQIVVKKAIKYAILTVCGVILFITVNRAALPERPHGGYGGEVFFLALPLFWWSVERVIKDFISEMKRQWAEIKAESEDEEGGENE